VLDLVGLQELGSIVAGWSDRVDLVRARSTDADFDAVLIRPDGHVAWLARPGAVPDLDALKSALATWLGPALP
jgi:3-(3-hydroxy-phenyl)propionate hydroxylase